MSTMSSQLRKIAKTYAERRTKVRSNYKSDEFLKHKGNALALLVSIRADRENPEDQLRVQHHT